jgi:prepilin-type N-terminal cleavage/methylation domain-containing protein
MNNRQHKIWKVEETHMRFRATLVGLRRRLPKNNQKGFTLIELLVVISILGILAAVVTMSLVGITRVATDRAASTEANTVQVAYDTMLADMRVNSAEACGPATSPAPSASPGTNDMSGFPSATAWTADPSSGTGGNFGKVVQLYPHYLREKTTHGMYFCTGTGTITQVPGSYVP